MTTSIPSLFEINGVIDTSKSVLENMNLICEATNAWMTFDIHQGKWAVVINTTGSSVASFTDTNIVGGISLSSTSLTEVYNSAEMEFPHQDLRDEPDYVRVSVNSGDRYPNEPDNVLSMSSQLVNNQAQAQIIASVALKQSRMDKVINFSADYSYIGLKAGDLIDITSTVYGFTNKVFRITSITEEDTEQGIIQVNITALEYDSSVYSTAGLSITPRQRDTSIVAKPLNSAIQNIEAEQGLKLDLSATAAASGLTLIFNSLTGRYELSQAGILTEISAGIAIITWTYQDGMDLDIRCRIQTPNLGQSTVDDYLGYTGSPSNTVWPTSGTAIITWGGDNTGVGGDPTAVETVFVNVAEFKSQYPSNRYLVIECRGNWFRNPNVPNVASLPSGVPDKTIILVLENGHNYQWVAASSSWVDRGLAKGFKPVLLTANVYDSGTVTKVGFNFTVTGFTTGRYIEGVSVFVDSFDDGTALGTLMGYLVIDTTDNTAQFRNDLTGIS